MRLLRTVVLAAAVSPGAALAATAPPAPSEPGFLVLAPDRGFLGNEEIRDAFESFAKGRRASLVVVTDERTRGRLDAALETLRDAGAARVVVLPLFLSRSDPRLARAAALMTDAPSLPALDWARPFGESVFAVEALASRLRRIEDRDRRTLVLVGSGAQDEAQARRLREDWQRIGDAAAAGLGFESVRVVLVPRSADLGAALTEAARGADRPLVVPFHLGSKLDGMMTFDNQVRGEAPAGAEVRAADLTPDASLALWMAREANRATPPAAGEIGVVVLAHGADYQWNETMRQAVAPLAARYLVEPAFSMADPVVIERAVRRLEARGARAIVILRVFGLAASFRAQVEQLIGLDVENGPPAGAAAAQDHGHHGHGQPAAPVRLLSSALLITVGGVEDHPLFAQTLLERARALSKDPARETLVLVAHGEGDDQRDAHWRKLLASIATRMRASGGDRFRAIRVGTWREDWPDKRRDAVAEVRTFVEEAATRSGRAIVVPARTLGQGPEKSLLEGLAFDLAEGFAPHPLFARWASEQVAAALPSLSAPARPARAGGAAGPGGDR